MTEDLENNIPNISQALSTLDDAILKLEESHKSFLERQAADKENQKNSEEIKNKFEEDLKKYLLENENLKEELENKALSENDVYVKTQELRSEIEIFKKENEQLKQELEKQVTLDSSDNSKAQELEAELELSKKDNEKLKLSLKKVSEKIDSVISRVENLAGE